LQLETRNCLGVFSLRSEVHLHERPDPDAIHAAAARGRAGGLQLDRASVLSLRGLAGHLGTYYPNATYFSFTDWLGTEHYRTDNLGFLSQACYNLPFGDGQTCNGTDSSPLHFTGKERDSESGLDNFEARYDASSLGRFMTPDPMGGHLENPQSLNKYAYVLNNPTSLTDPTGLDSYLSCTQTKDNASTCQSQTVGYDKNGVAQTATVQGVTNADKSFTATQIGNDANGNLVDKTTALRRTRSRTLALPTAAHSLASRLP
jgi:RHS repeat-associated protein